MQTTAVTEWWTDADASAAEEDAEYAAFVMSKMWDLKGKDYDDLEDDIYNAIVDFARTWRLRP